MKRSLNYLWLPALLLVAAPAVGCKTSEDNPTSADQMSSIRKKEAAGRANFNPSGTSPRQAGAPGK